MDDDAAFRTDLYRGTAPDYDRFRLPYSAALIDDVIRRTAVSGKGRLLDLACGTGQVAFALCDQFAEVWAVDQEGDAIRFGREKAAYTGAGNIRWIEARAEGIDPHETFELVTIGNAFHRLARGRVAALAMQWLRAGGHLALLWSSGPSTGSAPWQHTLADITARWTQLTGATDRVPAGLDTQFAQRPHATVLRDAGFTIAGKFDFVEIHEWTIETLVGFVYSTSILPRAVIGERAEEFETEVRDRLLAVEPSGVFRDEVSFGYDLAYRRAES